MSKLMTYLLFLFLFMCTRSGVHPAPPLPIIVKVIELTFRNYSDRLHKKRFQEVNCRDQGNITDSLYSEGPGFDAELGVQILESDFCTII